MAKGKELPSSLANLPSFEVTPDLRWCPTRKENLCANHFKGKHGKLYIVAEVNACRFPKKYELHAGFFNSAKENPKKPQK